MEQVEYPGMSGTNTMCVVTVLLETGMLPMTEPVTELTLESPAGLIRVTADCARRQGHRRHLPKRAGLRDAPRRTGRGAPASGPSRSTSPTAGCSTSSPTPSAFGLRLTPDEGADIVRITEMIKAAANEQLPVVHPEQPGFAGITIGQLSGPGPRPGEQPAQRRDRLDRELDWDRPATWTGAIDRSPCGTGTSARMATLHARGELGVGDDVPPRGDPRHGLHRPASLEETPSGSTGRSSRRSPARPGSPGFASYVVDPTDPFPDGFTIGDIWA